MSATIGLVTAWPQFVSDVRLSLDGSGEVNVEVFEPGGDPDVISRVGASDVDVVLIGSDVSHDVAISLAGALDRDRPDVSVVLVAKPTPEHWHDAMRAGVRDIVSPDVAPADLRDAVTHAQEAAIRRRAALPGAQEREAGRRRVITVISPKGGAGKTTVATNLAVGLAELAPGNVVIVDLDLQFGDVANALGLVPEHSIGEAVIAPGLDGTTLKIYLTPLPGGLYALCSPEHPSAREDMTSEQVERVLDLLRDGFRYVVVDTAPGLDEFCLAAAERSTDLVVVAATDVPTVRSVQRELDTLDELGFTGQRRHLVLNRADASVGLRVDDIAHTIGRPVDCMIPSSRDLPISMNRGTALLEYDRRSPAGRALLQIVERFAPVGSRRTTPVGSWYRRRR